MATVNNARGRLPGFLRSEILPPNPPPLAASSFLPSTVVYTWATVEHICRAKRGRTMKQWTVDRQEQHCWCKVAHSSVTHKTSPFPFVLITSSIGNKNVRFPLICLIFTSFLTRLAVNASAIIGISEPNHIRFFCTNLCSLNWFLPTKHCYTH